MESSIKRAHLPDTTGEVSEKRLKESGEPSDNETTSRVSLTSTSQADDDMTTDAKPAIDCTENESVPTVLEGGNERWQVHCRTVKERMLKLFKSDFLTDCTIIIGDNAVTKTYKLHSFVLCMASPVFEDLLSESQDKEITLQDVEVDVFEQILQYIYTDIVNLGSLEKAQSLYRAAQKFKLTLIIEKSVALLMSNMSYESIWPTLEAAHVTSDSILRTECFKYLKKHARILLKHPKFVNVDSSVVEDLVNEEVLDGLSEAELVNGVINWAKHQCSNCNLEPTFENQRHFINDRILPKLRFLTFAQSTFVREVASTNQREQDSILSRDESYSVLLNLVSPGIEPLPEVICKDPRLRIAGKFRCTRKVFNPMGNNPTYPSPFNVSQYDKMIVLANPSPIASFGAKNFSCEVTVNRSIELHGIQVPTFFAPQKPVMNEYDESYILTVQQSFNNKIVVTTTWKGKVRYNTTTELMLNDTVFLEKNIKYTIMLFTSNMYYVSRKLTNVEVRHPIQFTFKDVVSYFGAPATSKLGTDFGFIVELIYTPKDT